MNREDAPTIIYVVLRDANTILYSTNIEDEAYEVKNRNKGSRVVTYEKT